MRIHYLQHVAFEDLANIAVWAAEGGHAVTGTRLFSGDSLPAVDSFELLVVLGGPMNVDEQSRYPWLLAEKRLIGQAIDGGKAVLGICLGAQLTAKVLGAEVKQNPHKEIGWLNVSRTDDGQTSRFFRHLPPEFTAFHWHGDTFGIPAGAMRLAESEACSNQAFEYDARVLGLQFHLEYSHSSIARMIHHCGDELAGGPYVQSPAEMANCHAAVRKTARLLLQLLDAMRDQCEGKT